MTEVLEGLGIRALPLFLCLLRVGPVVYLCPLLGGRGVPGWVRFSVAVSLACLAQPTTERAWVLPGQEVAGLPGAALGELALGLTIGMVGMLPFEAARMGGRWVDVFRGSNAEVLLPGSGTAESVTAEMFHLLLVVLASESGQRSRWVSGVLGTFRSFPLGEVAALSAESVVAAVGVAFATGLSLGGPIAALSLLADLVFAWVGRWVPALQSATPVVPLRLLAGGALCALVLGEMNDRLLLDMEHAFGRLGHGGLLR